MANPEHIDILKQGGERWNKWRKENHDVTPDLWNADLTEADIEGANLHLTLLEGTRFTWANLRRANLSWSTLALASFSGATLSEADLRGAVLKGADFYLANLSEANLSKTDLREAQFKDCILVGARLAEAELSNLDLRAGDLTGADLTKAVLRDTHLNGAVLKDADLSGADLGGANLFGANLSGAHLEGASLAAANLTDAQLRGANLSLASLHSTILNGANLEDARFDAAIFRGTVAADVDLSVAKGLESVKHSGPSTVGIDTIYKSRGKIPDAFLRGCGLADEFIRYINSMVGRPIEFYTCFISYSTNDQKFADKLYADLQNKGVRCWFAPRDMHGGRKLHEQIQKAIDEHDKLLLILSEHSMNSNWVKTEIANTRAREDREKRQMLFPITLTPHSSIRNWKLFDADRGIDSAKEIREYFIPDFSNWKDHDAYQAAFHRLVKDLKAEAGEKV